ncbi:MAG: RNA polymerase sigma factor [Gemmatimonadaceae bacterium]
MAVRLRDPANEANEMMAAGRAGERDLVQRAQLGDVDAFGLLYHAHAAAIIALCRRMCGDEQRARELVQDVFVRAWDGLHGFRGHSALGTWLHRLAVNVVLEQLRVDKREVGRMVDAGDDLSVAGSLADQLDARIDLDAALLQLAPGARVVFVLHDIEGYSHEEISEMTGIAPGTARAQLWRARRALMRRLGR